MTQIHILVTPIPCKVLDIGPGAVVLVTFPQDISAGEIERLAETMKAHFETILPDNWTEDDRVQLIFAYDTVTIQSLDENMMGQAGWFRGPPKSRY